MDRKDSISKAIVFIENNLKEPLTAEAVSDSVSYSYYHFHRYFQAVMGETIGSYIRGRRLTQAAWELVHTCNKILDIALSYYFESAESFTRAFRKRYGITPTGYRKNGIDVLIGNRTASLAEDFISSSYAGLKPEILKLPAMTMAGISYPMSLESFTPAAMWKKFQEQLSMDHDIPSGQTRYSIFESSGSCSASTFCSQSKSNAFAGIEASSCLRIPKGMVFKKISGGTYAKFIHTGKADTLLRTYRYIWGVWFPKSGYDLSDRPDMEGYTNRFLGPDHKKSEIDVYFPVKA